MVFYTMKKSGEMQVGDSVEVEFMLMDLAVIQRQSNFNPNIQQFLRNVVIQQDGVYYQYSLGLGMIANTQLNAAIQQITQSGGNPLQQKYKLRKTKVGNQNLNITYVIIPGERAVFPQNIQQPPLPQSLLQPQFQQPTQPLQQTISQQKTQFNFGSGAMQTRIVQPGIALDRNRIDTRPTEGDLFDSLSVQPEIFSKDQFIDLWSKNISKTSRPQFERSRAELIYDELYNTPG